ncbi:hypothetical protein pEaSNUABM40_00124 [Erwinia phage pEa_SNUABM_40]|uniref:Uncharacterized protein n=1 Tax=Erwinia phage pEa_SNUABM_3 TaxID=2869552 RepID=A0AAE8BYR7_9CAUD|nr:hypothetical protein MPK68_gp123 [Erwinia phage pEa_SNUABM_3]QZE56659.1 hypothetical protein pEaSNUABM20_00123 [Erwinia phage pEa_SNUABM_20]QZE58340.1 hypothetical protein pEaSNUABM40_00124 [Erwinia phage pEa_SNUABM_40]UAW52904.1 hypothetical protein pEaSNUABM23_00122 [Erwinia phage pEa_SNUABM_23]UIW10800.1 hypothetical protein pEaSNUABM23_00122 [Erwinia phage pEa_SNUABM_31]QZE56320.1 hypothetical protein pEaSNUABM3_00123 [Erwinia phage pEa_SNUABM_3]
MLSLSQAWGTKFFPTAVEPHALTTLIFASAMNLTGARALAESAVEQNCHRAAQVARPFADAAYFIQRVYNKHPNYQIVVLGQGVMASHAVVADEEGRIVFDTYEAARRQYFPGCSYCYDLGAAGINELSVLSRATLYEAYQVLQNEGLWKDNAGSWDVDLPRGLEPL